MYVPHEMQFTIKLISATEGPKTPFVYSIDQDGTAQNVQCGLLQQCLKSNRKRKVLRELLKIIKKKKKRGTAKTIIL